MAIATTFVKIFDSAYLLARFVQTDSGIVSVVDIVTDASGKYVLIYSTTGGGGGGGSAQSGTQAFTAENTKTITLGTPIAGAAYSISLVPTADTGDGALPQVGYANKTATTFDIITGAAFTGSVDWIASAH